MSNIIVEKFDGDDMGPKWEAERKIAHELADKAWAEENLSPDGFVMVRPMTKYKNIYYALRYMYDKWAAASPHPLGCG